MIARSSFTILFAVTALLFCPALIGVEIDSRVIETGSGTDRSFQLIFIANDTPDAEPDFTFLMQDFYILHRNRNQSMKTINGRTSRTVRWTLQLLPKHAVIDTIPAIHFGKDSSPPVHLTKIGIAEAFPLGREKSLPVPNRPSPRPRAIRYEAQPPATSKPVAVGRPETPDGDSLGLELAILGGLGGLLAVMIKGYWNHRRRWIAPATARQKILLPPEPMTEAERVKQPPAPLFREQETAGLAARTHPSPPEQPVRAKKRHRSPAPILPGAGNTLAPPLAPPGPMTGVVGVKPSATSLSNHRDMADAAPLDHPSPPAQPIRTERVKLHQACLSTDPEMAGAALLEWARERWPDAPPHTLGSLASQFAGTDVEHEIRRLDKILYSPVKKKWHGATLWQVMKGFMVEQDAAPKKRHLFASFHTS